MARASGTFSERPDIRRYCADSETGDEPADSNDLSVGVRIVAPSSGDRNATLGHRRLAVIDIPGGSQPMSVSTADGEVAMVYSGEAYNFQELRDELVKRARRFKPPATPRWCCADTCSGARPCRPTQRHVRLGHLPFSRPKRNLGLTQTREFTNGRAGQHQWLATAARSGFHVDGLTR